jgi:hypothetical protein
MRYKLAQFRDRPEKTLGSVGLPTESAQILEHRLPHHEDDRPTIGLAKRLAEPISAAGYPKDSPGFTTAVVNFGVSTSPGLCSVVQICARRIS